MKKFLLSNNERELIFNVLSEYKKLSFNQLMKLTNLRSNKLSYQLKLMQKENFIVHKSLKYSLSTKSQKLIPHFSQMYKNDVGVLPVVLGIVRNKKKILLIQRKKMPYKGYWGLFGSKQKNGELISNAIERRILEESCLNAKFSKVNGILYERLIENNEFKHSFLFIITTLKASSLDAKEQNDGKVCWFDFKEIVNNKVKNIIPSDIKMIKKYFDKKIEIGQIIMEEKPGEKFVIAE